MALRSERSTLVDSYVAEFKGRAKLPRDTLDSAKLIALLEIERPHSVGWRSPSVEGKIFPPKIESVCTEALKSVGIKSSAALRAVLRSEAMKTAEKQFAELSLQVPTHLASALIAVATKSPTIFKDYIPDMASNPAMAPLLNS